MSCATNATKISLSASAVVGICKTPSKTVAWVGTVSNHILDLADREGTLARAARHPLIRVPASFGSRLSYKTKMTTVCAVLGMIALSNKRMSMPVLGLGALAVGALSASNLSASMSRLNADTKNGPVDQVAVTVRNTERLVSIWPKKDDTSALVFITYASGKWEKRMQQIEEQTWTTLRAKGPLGTEYHFAGALPNSDAVAIAMGNQDAHTQPGYFASITGREKHTTTWAILKAALIQQAKYNPKKQTSAVVTLRAQPAPEDIEEQRRDLEVMAQIYYKEPSMPEVRQLAESYGRERVLRVIEYLKADDDELSREELRRRLNLSKMEQALLHDENGLPSLEELHVTATENDHVLDREIMTALSEEPASPQLMQLADLYGKARVLKVIQSSLTNPDFLRQRYYRYHDSLLDIERGLRHQP